MPECKEDREIKILDKVREFCTSSQFEAEFEEFAKEYCDVFIPYFEAQGHDSNLDSDEYPLEFHNIYREYISRFERKIEDFIIGVVIILFFVINL